MPELQLRMVRPNLDHLPEINMPEEYELRTYLPGDESAWCEIMNTGIGDGWTPERCKNELTILDSFMPDGCFFVARPESREIVATACAWRNLPNGVTVPKGVVNPATVHMVCAKPNHRGRGLGYLTTLAVLHYMLDQGYKSAFLGTDDFRVPAIKTYLRLGFVPEYLADDHRKRWSSIFAKLPA